MKIEKTFYGFSIKNIWGSQIKAYKLFSQKEEYSLMFMGEPICKICFSRQNKHNSMLHILCSGNTSIAENEIIDLGVKFIEVIQNLD